MSIKPLPPHDAGGQDWRDKSKGGFDLRSLTSLVRDTNEKSEYSWRAKADLCHAYYDGKQLTEQQQLWAQSEGLVPRSTNLIQRVINAVLGYEAKSRSDVRIESDSDEIADVVVFLSSGRASWVCGAVLPIDGGRLHRDNWF